MKDGALVDGGVGAQATQAVANLADTAGQPKARRSTTS